MGKVRNKYAQLHPVLKGALWFVGSILIILIIAQILVSLFADDYAASYLKDQIRKSSDSTYTITFDDLDLSVFRGSATLTNLNIKADTAAFSDTSNSKKRAKILYSGTVGQLDVSGVNVFSAVWGKELHLRSITLTRPDIRGLRNPREIPKDTSSHFSSVDSSIYAAISGRYRALEIGDITIDEGRVLLSKQADTLSYLGTLNLTLENMRVDSASAKSGRRFITDDVSVQAENFSFKLPDSLNTVKFRAFSASAEDKTIVFDSLQLIPRYPLFQFKRHNGYRVDRLDLDVSELIIRDFDFTTYIDSGRVRAHYAELNDAHMEDFLNKSYPGGPNKKKTLPFISFKNSSQPIKIDSMKINNSFISYSEYVGGAPRAGTITFEQLDATLYNISNYPDDIKAGMTTVMDVRAHVMGKGLLNVHYEFPMDSQNGFHTIKGRLDEMPLSDFNRILQYVAFVRIDHGMLNSLQFDMTLNKDRSNGTVVMKYEDLKISMLDKSSIKQKGIMENLMTFVANNFIVRKNNTPEAGMKAGQVKFERIEHKSIFNYWWKSLLSGIKESIKK